MPRKHRAADTHVAPRAGAARNASIRDVARRAGVSASTVSRALRGNGTVASVTRDRVLRAASELSYSLPQATNRSCLVDVLAQFPARWFFARAITAIERTLSVSGYRLVLHNIGEPDGRRRFFERIVPLGQMDGLVIVATSLDARERAALEGLQIPITVVGGYAPGLPRVGIDDQAAARMATRHLIGLGHRDIGLISFAPEDAVSRDTTAARRRGFTSALSEAGLPVNPEWIIAADDCRMRGGARATEQLLTLAKLPTALFAMSDELAIGALRTLRRSGIAVPGRMSIVGFDDHEMAEFTDLTTIVQPVTQQAETATTLLLDRLRDGTGDVVDTNLPTRLVVRGTTGPPPNPGDRALVPH